MQIFQFENLNLKQQKFFNQLINSMNNVNDDESRLGAIQKISKEKIKCRPDGREIDRIGF